MGEHRRCVKFKLVESKKRTKGKSQYVARCVEFQDKSGKPVCPDMGLVTWGRSQGMIRWGRYSCRGVAPRTTKTARTLKKPAKRR